MKLKLITILCASLVLALLLAPRAMAEVEGYVYIKVVDVKNRPLPGVTVEFYPPEAEWSTWERTNVDGLIELWLSEWEWAYYQWGTYYITSVSDFLWNEFESDAPLNVTFSEPGQICTIVVYDSKIVDINVLDEGGSLPPVFAITTDPEYPEYYPEWISFTGKISAVVRSDVAGPWYVISPLREMRDFDLPVGVDYCTITVTLRKTLELRLSGGEGGSITVEVEWEYPEVRDRMAPELIPYAVELTFHKDGSWNRVGLPSFYLETSTGKKTFTCPVEEGWENATVMGKVIMNVTFPSWIGAYYYYYDYYEEAYGENPWVWFLGPTRMGIVEAALLSLEVLFLEEAYSSLWGYYQALKLEVGTLQGQIDTLNAQVNSLTAELSSTQAELESTQATLESTQAELESTQATLEETKSDLEATKTQIGIWQGVAGIAFVAGLALMYLIRRG